MNDKKQIEIENAVKESEEQDLKNDEHLFELRQIEEMAKIMAVKCGECDTCEFEWKSTENISCIDLLSAQALYNAGCRNCKDKVVLTERELLDNLNNHYDIGYKNGSKETAGEVIKAVKKMLKGVQECLDEDEGLIGYEQSGVDNGLNKIKKQFGVDVE